MNRDIGVCYSRPSFDSEETMEESSGWSTWVIIIVVTAILVAVLILGKILLTVVSNWKMKNHRIDPNRVGGGLLVNIVPNEPTSKPKPLAAHLAQEKLQAEQRTSGTSVNQQNIPQVV